MKFTVGSKVIYPAHGTAEVTGRSTRVVDGKKVKYLELSVAAGDDSWRGGNLKVSVPEDRAEDLGVRQAISEEEVEDEIKEEESEEESEIKEEESEEEVEETHSEEGEEMEEDEVICID